MLRPSYAARPVASPGERARVLLAAGAVHLVLLAAVVGPLWLASRSAGVLPAPDAEAGSLAASPVAFLLIAPLLEELVFRGWLTGRVAALRFAACGFAAMALMLAGVALLPEHGRMLAWAGAAVALAGLLHWGLTRERAHACTVPPAFIRHFGVIVWAQALLFGAIHLGNYADFASPLGLAVVLPQVLGGLLLAFIRTRAGLAAGMAYHAGYNGLVLAGGYLLA
ncbi:type II CAAX prenyl endopeptidase Rce1 family protein [Erythrobacter sp. CCH5-A1]|jgi:membrane protease YdiL (CAAX protease family)|uniref:CPBP family glutamic-type intramembrane protease n=1 Tax=Erythrobacter sp. CCH5-A1 TaxID=1768792 RepID=UPI00083162EE|nr:CPBP family glutamic-type intramembrane protease [Erythrobacter sp. CCH5-A1]